MKASKRFIEAELREGEVSIVAHKLVLDRDYLSRGKQPKLGQSLVVVVIGSSCSREGRVVVRGASIIHLVRHCYVRCPVRYRVGPRIYFYKNTYIREILLLRATRGIEVANIV